MVTPPFVDASHGPDHPSLISAADANPLGLCRVGATASQKRSVLTGGFGSPSEADRAGEPHAGDHRALVLEPGLTGHHAAAVERWGGIDVWINNAGVTVERRSKGGMAPLFLETEPDDWQKIMSLNVNGVLLANGTAGSPITFTGVGAGAGACYLVRPDGHIALALTGKAEAGLAAVTQYFKNTGFTNWRIAS